MSVITLHQEARTTPAGLVWENPPERATPGKYAAVAEALKERPGQWAIVRTITGTSKKTGWSFSNGVNAGKYADFRHDDDGRFEGRCRTIDGQCRVYVRYLPTTVSSAVAR